MSPHWLRERARRQALSLREEERIFLRLLQENGDALRGALSLIDAARLLWEGVRLRLDLREVRRDLKEALADASEA